MSEKQSKRQRKARNEQARKKYNLPAPVTNNNPEGLYPGYWNGERKAWFRIGVVRLLPVDKPPMHWQNALVGQERQVVQITYGGSTWLIDNETGQGLYKVTTGQGSPRVGHSSVSDCEWIREVPKEEWQQPDREKHEADRKIIEKWQETNYPELYAQMQKLKESMNNIDANKKV